MKAPDKIYLYREPPKDYFDEDWHELPASEVKNIEYIRKDLLFEWAKQKQYESTTIVADDFWQEVIDKLNSL